jgi:hypothetical protein
MSVQKIVQNVQYTLATASFGIGSAFCTPLGASQS